MSNQDSHQVKVGQPADPPLKGRNDFAKPRVNPNPIPPPPPSSQPPSSNKTGK